MANTLNKIIFIIRKANFIFDDKLLETYLYTHYNTLDGSIANKINRKGNIYIAANQKIKKF